MKKIAGEFFPLYAGKKIYNVKLSTNDIKKIIEYVNASDFSGDIVASCISISALAHILCVMSEKKSEIVIGAVLVNGKVFSHAWVEMSDGTVLCKPFDNYEYKPIKRFTFQELFYSTLE